MMTSSLLLHSTLNKLSFLLCFLVLCHVSLGVDDSCERVSGMVCYLSKKDHCNENWVLACAESRVVPEGSIQLGCRVYNKKDVVIEYIAGQEPIIAGYMEPDLLFFLYSTKQFRSVRMNVFVRVVGKYMTKGLQFPEKIFEFNALKTKTVDEYVGLRAQFNDIRAFYRRYDDKAIGSNINMLEMLVCRDRLCKRLFKPSDQTLSDLSTITLYFKPPSPMSSDYNCRQQSGLFNCGKLEDCCNINKDIVDEEIQKNQEWDVYCAGCAFKTSLLLNICLILAVILLPLSIFS